MEHSLLSHKKTETLPLATTWTDPEGVVPSAISQAHPAIFRACVLGSLDGIMEGKRRPLVGTGLIPILSQSLSTAGDTRPKCTALEREKGLPGTPCGLRGAGRSHRCFVFVALVMGGRDVGAEMGSPHVHEPACFPRVTDWW